jgi:hypothetical protein
VGGPTRLVHEFVAHPDLRASACRDERPQSAQDVLDEIRDIERAEDLQLLIAGG